MLTQEWLDELWDFSDPLSSEQRLRAAAAEVSGIDPVRDELTTQVARALGLQRRFAEALAMLGQISSDDQVVKARILLERGRILNSSGETAAAVPPFRTAAEEAAAAGHDFLAVDALHMLAIADPDGAEEWAARGLAAAEASPDPRVKRWAVALHNNLGWTRRERRDLDGARAEFQLALAAAQEWGTAEQQALALATVAECESSPPPAS